MAYPREWIKYIIVCCFIFLTCHILHFRADVKGVKMRIRWKFKSQVSSWTFYIVWLKLFLFICWRHNPNPNPNWQGSFRNKWFDELDMACSFLFPSVNINPQSSIFILSYLLPFSKLKRQAYSIIDFKESSRQIKSRFSNSLW